MNINLLVTIQHYLPLTILKPAILTLLDQNNISVVLFPANCTDQL